MVNARMRQMLGVKEGEEIVIILDKVEKSEKETA
jgi:hypothetical protein